MRVDAYSLRLKRNVRLPPCSFLGRLAPTSTRQQDAMSSSTRGKHGKHGKRQQQQQQQQFQQQPMMMHPMMMPQMMQQPMMQQWQPPQPPQPPQPDDGSEASSSESEETDNCVKRYQKNDEASITRSAQLIGKLPKIRVMQLVEASNRALDSTLTAHITVESCLRLIYLFSRVRPNTPCSHLRVKTYKKMMEKFSNANKRLKSRIDFGKLLDSLHDDVGLLSEGSIAQIAEEAEFQQEWLDDCFSKKSGRVHLGRSFGSSR